MSREEKNKKPSSETFSDLVTDLPLAFFELLVQHKLRKTPHQAGCPTAP